MRVRVSIERVHACSRVGVHLCVWKRWRVGVCVYAKIVFISVAVSPSAAIPV